MKPAVAKLHILLAREAPVGLVIRHGTAKSVCTLLWDRKKDKFTLGQWMRGRINLEFCDLSPDGDHFIYAATRIRRVNEYDKVFNYYAFTWTVVSQMPYLKALAYYQRRYGGWFESNRSYCAPGAPYETDREVPFLRRVDGDWPKKPDFYEARMIREGWEPCAEFNTPFRRPVGAGWYLYINRSRDTYYLRCEGVEIKQGGWDWAGVDGQRLVWTTEGCLYAGYPTKQGLKNVKLLHDFNGMKFENLVAPYPTGEPVGSQPQKPVRKPTPKPPRTPNRKKPDRSKPQPEG